MRNRELVYLALRIVLEKSIREKETICSSYKTTEIYSYTNQTVVNDSQTYKCIPYSNCQHSN